jgi:hypothetical protein
MKKRLRVDIVGAGMFATERLVRFNARGRDYSLFVDAGSIHDKLIDVRVVAFDADTVLIELPQETMTGGSRVRVENSQLVNA